MPALLTAMTNAAGGDRIRMASGNYTGTISSTASISKGSKVVIEPADRVSAPVITNGSSDNFINMQNLNGFVFDGIKFINNGKDTSNYPNGKTCQLSKIKNVDFINCSFFGGMEQLNLLNTEDCSIKQCEFTGSGMDSIRVYGKQIRLNISGNRMGAQNIDASRAGNTGRHPDLIQFASQTASTTYDTGVNGIRIEGNQMHVDQIVYSHGCLLLNEAMKNNGIITDIYRFKNFIFRNNDVRTWHVHGCAIHSADGFLVERNRFHRAGTETGDINCPRVGIIKSTSGGAGSSGIVRNNVVPRLPHIADWEQAASSAVQVENNIVNNTGDSAPYPTGWVALKVGPYADTAVVPVTAEYIASPFHATAKAYVRGFEVTRVDFGAAQVWDA